jgi:Holliday junction DNA helicase RuvA
MITFLDGILDEKQPARVVMSVQGVGYEVLVPLSSLDQLPAQGEPTRLLIYHHMTELSQTLFGFATDEERQMFRQLLGVSGIGPKTAISALSGLSVRELKSALATGDVKRISSISGIGKKTAERVIVELKDKFTDEGGDLSSSDLVPTGEEGRLYDASLALVSLGYKQTEARKMIEKTNRAHPEASVEELIRMALTGR